MTQYQLLPFARTATMLHALAGNALSPGTLSNAVDTAAMRLQTPVAAIREALVAAPIAHADETGMRVGGAFSGFTYSPMRTFGARRAAWNQGVVVQNVIDDQFGDHPDTPAVGQAHETAEVTARSIGRIDVVVIGDIVAIVPHGRWIEGQQLDRVGAQIPGVVELRAQAAKVADSVPIPVIECLDMGLVDDRVLVPEWAPARTILWTPGSYTRGAQADDRQGRPSASRAALRRRHRWERRAGQRHSRVTLDAPCLGWR